MCLQREASLPEGLEEEDAFDDTATAFLDEQLLTAVSLVNMDLEQETRQVVLVGCGLDTRPYRQGRLLILHSCLCIALLLHHVYPHQNLEQYSP